MTEVVKVVEIENAPGPGDYEDIVAWLRTGSVMCANVAEAGDPDNAQGGGFLAVGMAIAAERIVALEAEIAELRASKVVQ